MTRDDLRDTITVTISELAERAREAVLAGNPAGAAQWTEALWNASGALSALDGEGCD